jgi:hypothetical protein
LALTTTLTIKGAVVWDNKFILAWLSKIKGDNKTAKTDDRLELNSIWGKKKQGLVLLSILILKRRWTLVTIKCDANISHFFSPAYFQLGPGMLWKKK